MVDYTDRLLERFHRMIRDALETFNQHSGKPYTVSLSCGAYIAEANSMCRIEDFLRVSDARMYEEKFNNVNGQDYSRCSQIIRSYMIDSGNGFLVGRAYSDSIKIDTYGYNLKKTGTWSSLLIPI